MKIKCPNCGRYTDEGNNVCYWCNANINESTAHVNQPTSPVNEPKQRKKSGNMFVEAAEYRPADSVNECLQPDPLVQNLWRWSQSLERFGKILMIVLLIIGVIYIIDAGITVSEHINAKDFETYRQDYFKATGEEYPTIFEAVIDAIFDWAIICFIVYSVYHALAMLVGALASITHNTKVTARLAEYTARHGAEIKKAVEEEENKLPEL